MYGFSYILFLFGYLNDYPQQVMKPLVYLLAGIHLLLVTLAIFHVFDEAVSSRTFEKPLAFWCGINYSVWQYGFFSPDVGKSTEIEIKVYSANTKPAVFSTLNGFAFYTSNIESANRFYDFKVQTGSDTVFQDLFARSIATRIMNVDTTAWRVDYVMRSIRYPTMVNFSKGVKPRIVEFYSTEFDLR